MTKDTKKINQLNAKGRKEGLWITTTKTDGRKTIVNYVNGSKEGVLEEYDKSGLLRCRINHVKNKKHGLLESYFKNGHRCERINYTEGKEDGLVEWYHQSNGQLMSTRTEEMGLVQGTWITYHENGELRALAYCIDDEFHGVVSEYNDDGSLQYVRHYNHGKEIKTLYNMHRVRSSKK